jgi:hypothetical protein
MKAAEYHSIDAMSASQIIQLYKSKRDWLLYQSGLKEKSSKSMNGGTFCHMALLEPDNYSKLVIVPETRIDNKGKEVKAIRNGEWWSKFQTENPSEHYITQAQKAETDAMASSAMSHGIASSLILGCDKKEESLFFDSSGLAFGDKFGPCKARLDGISITGRYIVDLKTTRAEDQVSFFRAADRYGYDIQAAWYMQAAAACGFEVKDYYIIAISNQAPYTIMVFMVFPSFLERGRRNIAEAEQNWLYGSENDHRYPDLIPLEDYSEVDVIPSEGECDNEQ